MSYRLALAQVAASEVNDLHHGKVRGNKDVTKAQIAMDDPALLARL